MSTLTAQNPRGAELADNALPLELRWHDGEDRCQSISTGATTIGSGPRCTLRLRAPGLQPMHCVISHEHGETVVRRWGADTLLNGEEFRESTLKSGDRLTVGAIELQVEAHAPEAEAPAPTAEAKEPIEDEGDFEEVACSVEEAEPKAEESAEEFCVAELDPEESTPEEPVAEAPELEEESPAAPLPVVPPHLLQPWLPASVSEAMAEQKAPFEANEETFESADESEDLVDWSVGAAQAAAEDLPVEFDTDEVPPPTPSAVDWSVDAEVCEDHSEDFSEAKNPSWLSTSAKEARSHNRRRAARIVQSLRDERNRTGELSSELEAAREAAEIAASAQKESEDQLREVNERLALAESKLEEAAGSEQRVAELQSEVERLEAELSEQTSSAEQWEARIAELESLVAKLETTGAPEVEPEAVSSYTDTATDATPKEVASQEGSPEADEAPVDWGLGQSEADAEHDESAAKDDPAAGDDTLNTWAPASESQASEPLWGEPAGGSEQDAHPSDERSPQPEQAVENPWGVESAKPAPADSTNAGELWDIEAAVQSSIEPETTSNLEPAPTEAASSEAPSASEAWLESFTKSAASEEAPPTGPAPAPPSEEPSAAEAGEAKPEISAWGDGDSTIAEEIVVASPESLSESAPVAQSWEDLISGELSRADSEPVAEQAAGDAPQEAAEPPAPLASEPEAGSVLDEIEALATATEQRHLVERPVEAPPTQEAEEHEPAPVAEAPPQTADDLIPDEQPSGEAPQSFIAQFSGLLPEDTEDDEPTPAAPAATPVAEPVSEEDSADSQSIDDYMAGLMQRIRGEAAASHSPAPAAPKPAQAPKPSAPKPTAPSALAPDLPPDVAPPVDAIPLSSLEELKRGPAPEHSTDMSALRDLANSTARTALGVAATKQSNEKAVANLAISGMAMACGAYLGVTAPGFLSTQFLVGFAGFGWSSYWASQTLRHMLAAGKFRNEAQQSGRTQAAE